VSKRYSCLIVVSACLFAQPESSPAARELSMTKTVNEAGNTTIRLHNQYSAAATAWIVECYDAAGSRWYWSDRYLSLDPKPLEPEKEIEFVIPKPVSAPNARFATPPRMCDNFHVIAAVFADGTVTGDLSWITAIVDERRSVYQNIAKAIDMLNQAAKDGTDQAGVVKQFVGWQNGELPGRARASKDYGDTFGWRSGDRQGPPPPRPSTRAAVPGLTISLIQEQAKGIPGTIKALQDWRERLGQVKLVPEATAPTSPPDTVPTQRAQAVQPSDPGLGRREQDLQQAALNGIQVLPGATDPAITNFNFPHTIYVNREIVVSHKTDLPADRHQLLLFIPGTHVPGGPRGGKGPFQFLQLAANLGYRVVNLTYPDETAAAQVCNDDKDPLAFESFRLSIIAGGSSPHIQISRTDSIENRLIKLLLLLKQVRPLEHWEQFLSEEGSIKWESIVAAGQSQGGGHAALIAIKHPVARVICTGAPKDYSHALNKPAAWYLEASATPKSRFFAFNHLQDRMGNCSLQQQMENLRALGLNEFGAAADVDTEKPPYHHARILTTNYPGGQVSSGEAHTSVIANEVFKDVWSYMLTETVQGWPQAKGLLRIAASRKRLLRSRGRPQKTMVCPTSRPKAYSTILRGPRRFRLCLENAPVTQTSVCASRGAAGFSGSWVRAPLPGVLEVQSLHTIGSSLWSRRFRLLSPARALNSGHASRSSPFCTKRAPIPL